MTGNGFDYITGDISENDSKIEIDINKLLSEYAGKTPLTVSVERLIQSYLFSLNTKMKLLRTIPDSVMFSFTEKYSKKIPVIAVNAITFQKQYMQSGPAILYPDSIVLAGDKIVIDKINFIKTEKLAVKATEKNIIKKVNLIIPASAVSASQKTVWIFVPVEEYAEGKIKSKIRKANYVEEKIQFEPSSIEITYRAPVKYFKNIHETDFITEIDFSCLPNTHKTNKMRVEISKIPKYAVVTGISPAYVDCFQMN